MKAFLFDVDGTLTPYGSGVIPESAIKALKKLKEKGHKVGIVTGRNLSQVEELFDIDLFDFISLTNGAFFYVENELKKARGFDEDTLNKILGILRQEKIGYFVSDYYASISDELGLDESIIDLCLNGFHVSAPKLEKIEGRIISQIMTSARYEDINKFSNIEGLEFMKYPLGYGFDICKKDVNKARGVNDIKEYYNLDDKNIYIFGDALNDLAMFKTNVNKIAMGNACNEIKELADYVTADASDDGVYKALKYLEVL